MRNWLKRCPTGSIVTVGQACPKAPKVPPAKSRPAPAPSPTPTPSPTPSPTPTPTPTPTPSSTGFSRVALGGGGQTMRLKISGDGTMTVSTDTDNGFYRGPSDTAWKPMLSSATAGFSYNYAGGGALDTTVHPTNSAFMATWQMGFLWLTTDGWATATKIAALSENRAIAPNTDDDGGQHMTPGFRLEYDNSTAILAFADPSAGLRYTPDGGTTWALATGIAAPTAGLAGTGAFVAFDRSSSVSSGKFQTVYGYMFGRGVYRATAGITGTFSLIASSPTALVDMKVGPSGILFVVKLDGTGWTWTSGGGWVQTTDSGIDTLFSVLPHPSDPTKVYWLSNASRIYGSSDSGASIDRTDRNTVPVRVAADYPWLAWTKEDFMGNGGGVFHPTLNRILTAEGIGNWYTDNPLPLVGSQGPSTWTSLTTGIDQLVTMEHCVAGDRFYAAFSDRPVFAWDLAALATPPTHHGHDQAVQLSNGTSVDTAPEDPHFAVSTGSAVGRELGYTTDGGATWAIPTIPNTGGKFGGNIAVASKTNWVWLPSLNGTPFYTTNGGFSWAACGLTATISGFPIHNSSYLQRRCLACDKVTGYFYLLVVGDGTTSAGNLAAIGLWRSTDGGATWARVRSSLITRSVIDFWNCKLRPVPGKAGDMFWITGDIGGYDTDIAANQVFFSHDGGGTFNSLAGLDESYDVAFGKPAALGAYPTLFVYGFKGGTLGLYRCTDFDPSARTGTWRQIGPSYPLDAITRGVTLSGDMASNKVFIGWVGAGLAVGEFA